MRQTLPAGSVEPDLKDVEAILLAKEMRKIEAFNLGKGMSGVADLFADDFVSIAFYAPGKGKVTTKQ